MALPLTAPPTIDPQHAAVIVDLWLASTCPLQLPQYVGGGPWRLAARSQVIGESYGSGSYGPGGYGLGARMPWPEPYGALAMPDAVAYWPLADVRRTRCSDVRGSHHGSYLGDASIEDEGPIAGRQDWSLRVIPTANTGHASIPSATALQHQSGEWAIACWFRALPSGSDQWVVAKGTAVPYPYRLIIWSTGELMWRRRSATVDTYLNVPGSWADGQWHHTVFQLRQGMLECWLDGQLRSTGTDGAGQSGAVTNTSPITLGALSLTHGMSGSVAHVAYYAAALSPERIAAMWRRRDMSHTGAVEGRLLDEPSLTRTLRDALHRAVADTITIRIDDRDGEASRRCLARDVRGQRMTASIYDAEAGIWLPAVWDGRIAAVQHRPGMVEILGVLGELVWRDLVVPRETITTAWAPYAPEPAPPSGGLGDVVTVAQGIGRRIPARAIRTRVDEDTSQTATVLSVHTGTDMLTTTEHTWATGDGPIRVASTGRVPGGLRTLGAYWAIVPSSQTLQLARSPEDAALGIAIDLTDAGTGTITCTSGLPAQHQDTYDYLVCRGAAVVTAVYADGVLLAPDAYRVRYVDRVRGRTATVVRLHEDPGASAITVDAEAVLPDITASTRHLWCWDGVLIDRITEHALRPGSSRGSAWSGGSEHWRPGPTGLGPRGAWLIPTATTPYVETGPEPLWTEGTLWVWLRPRTETGWQRAVAQYAAGTVLWALEVQRSTRQVRWREAPGVVATSATNTLPRSWGLLVVRRRATRLTVHIDGAVVIDQTMSTAMPRPSAAVDGPIILGDGTIEGTRYRGHLGPILLDGRVWSDREVAHAVARAQRSPVAWVAELVDAAGLSVDPTSLATATTALATVPYMPIRWDGWVTDARPLGSELDGLAEVGITVSWVAGLLSVSAWPRPTEAIGPWGIGGQGILELGDRRQAAIDETPRLLQLAYRPRRDTTGRITGYLGHLERALTAVGSRDVSLEVPAIDAHASADRVLAWAMARRQMAMQTRTVALGYRALQVTPGQVIAVRELDGTVGQWLVLRTQYVTGEVTCDLVPYDDAQLWTYQAGSYPTDSTPADAVLAAAVLGLAATGGMGMLTAQLAAASTDTMRPVGDVLLPSTGAWTRSHTAMRLWELLADDEQATFAATTQTAAALACRIGAPTTYSRMIAWVDVVLRARRVAAAAVQVRVGLIASGVLEYGSWQTLGLSYADITWRYGTAPGARPWTSELASDMIVIVEIAGEAPTEVELAELTVPVRYRLDWPSDAASYLRWWVRGPSETQPAAPLRATDPPTAVGDAPLLVVPRSAGRWWVWVAVYDQRGQWAQTIGPVSGVVA